MDWQHSLRFEGEREKKKEKRKHITKPSNPFDARTYTHTHTHSLVYAQLIELYQK